MRIISFSNTLDVDVLVLKIKYIIPKCQIYELYISADALSHGLNTIPHAKLTRRLMRYTGGWI